MPNWHMAPMGEAALLIEHGSPEVAVANPAVIELGRRLHQRAAQAQIRGIESIIPAIQSVLIRFDPLQCSRVELERLVWQVADETASQQVNATANDLAVHALNVIQIGVRYGGEAGPDLDDVARHTGLAPQDIIALHTAQPMRVLMMGFAPGFAYLGPLPVALNIPRRSTPRAAVPAGSVAIAAGMTGVYPARLPGGWHIIGRTDEVLFDPAQQPPSRIQPAGGVQFVCIGNDWV